MTHIAYSTPATYPHVAALDPTPWMASALCAQVEPDLFYPDRSADTREAKKVCGQCEVRTQCLAYALANGETEGVWGGLSERERQGLPEKHLASHCPNGHRYTPENTAGSEKRVCRECRAERYARYKATKARTS